MIWRIGCIGALVAGTTMLAYEIGARLSEEAILTLIGVGCGFVASIPISLGLAMALVRQRQRMNLDHLALNDRKSLVLDETGQIVSEPFPPLVQASMPSRAAIPYLPYAIYPSSWPLLPPGYPRLGDLLPPYPHPVLSPPIYERDFKIIGEEEE